MNAQPIGKRLTRNRADKPLDFKRAFETAIKLFEEMDKPDKLINSAYQTRLDNALTPPLKRGLIARKRAVRARNQRLILFLARYIRRFGTPCNIDTFINALKTKGWLKIAPPGPAKHPGPSKPRNLGGQTIRNMLRKLGVVGLRGRKPKK